MKTLQELKYEAAKENNVVKYNAINFYERTGDVSALFDIIGKQWDQIKKYEEEKYKGY